MDILKTYFDGLAQRQLLIPYCQSCGKPHFYPRHACPACWSTDYSWRQASGRGTIHTHTEVIANPPSRFAAEVPFHIAVVELEEGVRMLSNVSSQDIGRPLAIGDAVRLAFIVRHGETLPVFERD